ncbi:MAG TPA: FmdB family zinc ribbon protein [Actinomycetota bacterium]|nr:FmdB family zinc ribbon protein [Actinomycetota bacterium]
MPIYEYACTACGERTEAKQAFADPPLTECSLCGGSLRKLYSPVGIVFKGSGFYSTDAKKKATTSSDGAGSSSGPDKTDKTETKKDSKKDAKPDAAPPPKPTTERSA